MSLPPKSPRPGTQNWSLDMLGNWNTVGTDIDGDTGDISELDTRTHNMANELLSRSLTSTVPIYDHAYDAAGNTTEVITGPHAKRRYTHDAWNRMVRVENGITSGGGTTTWTTIGQYQYNGLHWRVVADGDRATPTGLDQRRTMYYSAGWQLLQEDIDDHTNNGSPDGVNSRSQEVWGLRYIDDAMVRLLDKNLDGDCRDSGELFWQLSDAQFSTIAVIDKNAVLQERVSYTSYGVGTHRWPHEVNNTGGVTTSGGTSDYGVIDGLAQANSGAGTPINDPNGNYNVAADLNRDGVIDSTDTSIFTSTFGGAKSALASGIISDPSGPDNVFGYDGYVYNPDQGLYTVRFRWYSPTFGRWLERDPAGYVDGANVYVFTRTSPTALSDPLGLASTSSSGEPDECTGSCKPLSEDCETARKLWEKNIHLNIAVIDACGEDDAVVKAIRQYRDSVGQVMLAAGSDILQDILVNASGGLQEVGRVALRDATDEAGVRAAKQLMTRAGLTGAVGKCLGKVGGVMDANRVRKGLRDGDALEVVGGVSGLLLNFFGPAGKIIQAAGGMVEAGVDVYVVYAQSKAYARKNEGRCAFLKGQHADYSRRLELALEKCDADFVGDTPTRRRAPTNAR